MNDLNQISEIFAGLLNVRIIKSTDILVFGDIIESELQSIVLKIDTEYTQILFTVGSSDLKSNSNMNKIAFHDNGIEMFLSGNDLDQVQEFTSMDGNTYILILEDRLNRLWVLGTLDFPLRFSDKYSTGKAMRGANGRTIVFESDSKISILSYTVSETPVIVADDWFLPSEGDQLLIYSELIVPQIGNFDDGLGYWTSTEHPGSLTHAHAISPLGNVIDQSKAIAWPVCVARAFTSALPLSVGDVGEAGWIFYKNGNNYLEARFTELAWAPWGDNNLITGANDASVGAGQSNTNIILAADPTAGIAARIADGFVLYE